MAKASKRSKRKREGAFSDREIASGGAIQQNIVRGLAHPLRVRILTVLNDRVASPNELSKELEEGLSQVSYHIKVLKDFEMIEMTKTLPRRGAVEHFYRATSRFFVPSSIAKSWPKSAREGIASMMLELVEVDLIESIETGLFNDRPDHVVTRDPRTLDGKGREDAEIAAAEFFERYEEISDEADKRLKKGDGDGERIQTSAVLLVFTSLKGKRLKLKKKT
jgi:DNA-binding transcriptional ArsR family regulator